MINITTITKEPSLETQILQLRKLHTEALQMLVVMGKNMLATQQQLLGSVQSMRQEYAKFEAFMEVNAARLNDPADDTDND